MTINFDNIGADWTFDYGATVLTKPYSGKPYITCSSTEVAISGTIQSLVLKCQSDIDSLEQWFIDGSKLVTCPVFYTAPISFEGVDSYYDQTKRSISWADSPYSYSGAYYTGTNADEDFNVLNPLEPVFFKLNIVPLERGYRYYQPTPNSPRQVDAIPFIVLPRIQPDIPIPQFINLTPESFDENLLNPVMTLSTDNPVTTFTLVSGFGDTDNADFSITGDELTFNGIGDFETKPSYDIRVRGTLAAGGFAEREFTINVNDLNEPPTSLVAFGFPITIPTGPTFGSGQTYNIVATQSITQDAQGRIAFEGGASGGGFGGGGGGGGGYSTVATFTNTATMETFVAILLLENNPAPIVIASLDNNDPDSVVNATYELVSGVGDTDNALFFITGSDLSISITTDYEVKKEYSIRLRVTTDGGLFTELPIRVNIVQIPEYPNDIALTLNSSILVVNDLIGTLSSLDDDAFSIFTYTIVGGGLQPYLTISGNQLLLDTPLDGLETDYSVTIRSTDETLLWVERTFVLNKDLLTNTFYFKDTTSNTLSNAVDEFVLSADIASSTLTEITVNTDMASSTSIVIIVNTDFAATTRIILLN